MIYLDTHVVVWLAAGENDRFTSGVRNILNREELFISPAVMLEIQFLKETGRVSASPVRIFEYLAERIGLAVCKRPFQDVVAAALGQSWTRDPFDRLIAAQAILAKEKLLTKDSKMLMHCPNAVWK